MKRGTNLCLLRAIRWESVIDDSQKHGLRMWKSTSTNHIVPPFNENVRELPVEGDVRVAESWDKEKNLHFFLRLEKLTLAAEVISAKKTTLSRNFSMPQQSDWCTHWR